MTIEIIADIEQNTPAWMDLRRGIVTASEIGLLLGDSAGKRGEHAGEAFEFGGYWLGREEPAGDISRYWIDENTGRVRRKSLKTKDLDVAKSALAEIVAAHPEGTLPLPCEGNGTVNRTRRKYMLRLAAERLGAEPADVYATGNMLRGHLLEEEARRTYAYITGEDPEKVGFIRNGILGARWAWAGASPDALIANRRGGIEIKTKQPDLQMEILISGEVPNEHLPQVQGHAMIGELEFVDFVSYWPGLPQFIKRVPRDEAYIATLRGEVDRLNEEIAVIVETIGRYGEPLPASAAA